MRVVRKEYPAAWDGPPDATLALMVASGRTPTQSANSSVVVTGGKNKLERSDASVEDVTQRKAPKKK